MSDKQKKKSCDSHKICEICHIRERRLENNLFFAGFPLSETRCKEWLKVVGKAELVYTPQEKLYKHRHVCGKHFKKRDFTKNGTKLKKMAIPSLHLTREPLAEDLVKEFPLKTKDCRILLEHNYVDVIVNKKMKICTATSSVVQNLPSVEYRTLEPDPVQTCEADTIVMHEPQITYTAKSQQSQEKLVPITPLNTDAAARRKKLLLDENASRLLRPVTLTYLNGVRVIQREVKAFSSLTTSYVPKSLQGLPQTFNLGNNQRILEVAYNINQPCIRTVTKFSLKKGKRKTVKAALKRFFRLDWGGWIRPKVGRNKKLWKKSPAQKRRLRQHVLCNATQSTLLDKMVTKFWKRPKYYVDDPYEPYHTREEFWVTRRKPWIRD